MNLLLPPVIFTLGLFLCIGLGSYFRYKRTAFLAGHLSQEMFSQWYRNMLLYKIISNRSWGLRWSGVLFGGGVGFGIGAWIRLTMEVGSPQQEAVATLLIVAAMLVCASAGLIGAYCLERRLDRFTDKFEQPQ